MQVLPSPYQGQGPHKLYKLNNQIAIKPLLIFLTNTNTKPRTVVIMSRYTLATFPAMFSPQRLVNLTDSAMSDLSDLDIFNLVFNMILSVFLLFISFRSISVHVVFYFGLIEISRLSVNSVIFQVIERTWLRLPVIATAKSFAVTKPGQDCVM